MDLNEFMKEQNLMEVKESELDFINGGEEYGIPFFWKDEQILFEKEYEKELRALDMRLMIIESISSNVESLEPKEKEIKYNFNESYKDFYYNPDFKINDEFDLQSEKY